MKKITIGARGSKLSQAYVGKVKELILRNNENFSKESIVVKTIKTSGDIYNKSKLSEIGGKKLFCKEIEEDLLANNIDIAVHSLKDMESEEHSDLMIGAFIKRNDPREALISEKIKDLNKLKPNTKIGSSSRRRELQLKRVNKNFNFVNMRGNIDTRINKFPNNNLDGIILAAAGVKSLNLEKKISLIFETSQMMPSLGQGIIAVQCRKNDMFVQNILKEINDNDTSLCAKAERNLLKTIGGDCDTAIGGLAIINGQNLILKAELFSDDGKDKFTCEISGKINEAFKIGKTAGQKLLELAGSKFKLK
tara:strand:- start:8946 stop:9866 length:921 start_codon:yes stop_codon:yes gene_type:complete